MMHMDKKKNGFGYKFDCSLMVEIDTVLSEYGETGNAWKALHDLEKIKEKCWKHVDNTVYKSIAMFYEMNIAYIDVCMNFVRCSDYDLREITDEEFDEFIEEFIN